MDAYIAGNHIVKGKPLSGKKVACLNQSVGGNHLPPGRHKFEVRVSASNGKLKLYAIVFCYLTN
jgi:hypothetical protein